MKLKKIFTEVILTLLVISGTTLTYALLSDLKVSSGNTLTSTLWNNLVDHSVPSGAVMSFDLETCPTGWTEYTALQGKFIRGADTGANNDPNFTTRSGGTGARKIGSTQGDILQGHFHDNTFSQSFAAAGSISVVSITYAGASQTEANRVSSTRTGYATDFVNGNPRIGVETRPANVYLLYCKKN